MNTYKEKNLIQTFSERLACTTARDHLSDIGHALEVAARSHDVYITDNDRTYLLWASRVLEGMSNTPAGALGSIETFVNHGLCPHDDNPAG